MEMASDTFNFSVKPIKWQFILMSLKWSWFSITTMSLVWPGDRPTDRPMSLFRTGIHSFIRPLMASIQWSTFLIPFCHLQWPLIIRTFHQYVQFVFYYWLSGGLGRIFFCSIMPHSFLVGLSSSSFYWCFHWKHYVVADLVMLPTNCWCYCCWLGWLAGWMVGWLILSFVSYLAKH